MEPTAQCALHPEQGAVETCPQCGNFMCAGCLTPRGGRFICTACASQRAGTPTPWDRRAELGTVRATWETVRDLTFSPVEFFDRLDPDHSPESPALFAFVSVIPAGIVGAATNIALQEVIASFLGGDQDNPLYALIPGGAMGANLLGAAVGPFLAVLILYMYGMVAHGGLWLFGARGLPVQRTTKVALYAGAMQAWGVIPVVGSVIGLLWYVYLALGLARVHGVSRGVAFAAVFLPMCCLVLGLSVFIGIAAFAIAGLGGDLF